MNTNESVRRLRIEWNQDAGVGEVPDAPCGGGIISMHRLGYPNCRNKLALVTGEEIRVRCAHPLFQEPEPNDPNALAERHRIVAASGQVREALEVLRDSPKLQAAFDKLVAEPEPLRCVCGAEVETIRSPSLARSYIQCPECNLCLIDKTDSGVTRCWRAMVAGGTRTRSNRR